MKLTKNGTKDQRVETSYIGVKSLLIFHHKRVAKKKRIG